MPFTPSTPEVKDDVPVTTVQSKTLDVYHIDSLKFDLGPPVRCTVQWSVGYNDDQGNYVPVTKNQARLQGTEFLAKLNGQPTTGKTRYEDVKAAIWELLQAQGAVGPGSIT